MSNNYKFVHRGMGISGKNGGREMKIQNPISRSTVTFEDLDVEANNIFQLFENLKLFIEDRFKNRVVEC